MLAVAIKHAHTWVVAADIVVDDSVARIAEFRGSCERFRDRLRRGSRQPEQGLYDETRLASANLDGTGVAPVPVRDVNHYTLLTGNTGSNRIANHLLALSGA
ncbi:hypothetical protein [Streptomyces sp. NPDC002785]|uniref:hypothetical protein n=1 Tax=Streptomyces sp. NPDC002785 TaxID=3154543 RepID=UPI00331DE566